MAGWSLQGLRKITQAWCMNSKFLQHVEFVHMDVYNYKRTKEGWEGVAKYNNSSPRKCPQSQIQWVWGPSITIMCIRSSYIILLWSLIFMPPWWCYILLLEIHCNVISPPTHPPHPHPAKYLCTGTCWNSVCNTGTHWNLPQYSTKVTWIT